MRNLPILFATKPQRKNLITLVNYLISLRGTPLADAYDHNYERSCSFGYAIKSGKIKALKKHFVVETSGSHTTYHTTDRDAHHPAISDAVFGSDYHSYIVNGPYSAGYAQYAHIKNVTAGPKQMEAVINALIHAYQMTAEEVPQYVEKVEVDKTRNRIESRIKKLEAFVTSASAFDDDDTIKLSQQVQIAKAEIKGLKRALEV